MIPKIFLDAGFKDESHMSFFWREVYVFNNGYKSIACNVSLDKDKNPINYSFNIFKIEQYTEPKETGWFKFLGKRSIYQDIPKQRYKAILSMECKNVDAEILSLLKTTSFFY